jgi:Phytanoyl-CoA dioxygenase (PhyH)
MTDFARLHDEIYRDGFAAMPGVLSTEWADRLADDVNRQLVAALEVEHGAGVAFRGWNRFYLELYPERISGFAELAEHAAVDGCSRSVLGDEYRIVELGADVPLPGAPAQPPHRDFPMPEPTRLHRRLTSLAFNTSCVDGTADMGPFNIAPGSHLDPGDDFVSGMFPVGEERERYARAMVERIARRGGVSVRSGLTLHRGTRNSGRMRQVVILGVVSPEDRAHPESEIADVPADYARPTLKMSQQYYESLSESLRRRLSCVIVCDSTRELPPLETPHSIEGLVMGQAPDGI